MHWIVQNNFYNEQEYDRLITSLERMDVPHDMVKVIPFVHETEPEVNPTGLVMVYGSTAMSKIAAKRGWLPGSFLNENHDYRQWGTHYGEHCLNTDSIICRYEDVDHTWDEFFIRPTGDNKQFAGMISTYDAFKEWQHKVLALKECYTTLDADTMVCYGPVKEIWAEYRFFVVDGRIITYSQYKQGTRILYNPVVDDDAIIFAQKMIELWCPARGFVIDIALTNEGHRVIEINCLNSSGLYAINAQKLVEAIEGMTW